MADQDDVRRIARSLPGAREDKGHFAFSVENKGKQKGFVWVWMERVHPKKARVPCPEVLAVRVRDQGEKAMLIAGDPDTFFTEPHYNGFPAVLVRLPVVKEAQLRKLIVDAWRCQAPPQLLKGDPPTRARRKRPKRGPARARAAGGGGQLHPDAFGRITDSVRRPRSRMRGPTRRRAGADRASPLPAARPGRPRGPARPRRRRGPGRGSPGSAGGSALR